MQKFKEIMKKTYELGIDLLFPNYLTCICCNNDMPDKTEFMVCEKCIKQLPFITNACKICGEELLGTEDTCIRCQTRNRKFNIARATFSFKDKIISLVHNLKYNEEPWLAKFMAAFMVDTYLKNKMDADVLIPVPITKKKLKKRGYNQAKLLADEVSKLTGIPVINAISKVIDTDTQTKHTAVEREMNLIGAFSLDSTIASLLNSKKILIIDDVFTTGATSNACCGILSTLGIKKKNISVLTFAHTNSPLADKVVNKDNNENTDTLKSE